MFIIYVSTLYQKHDHHQRAGFRRSERGRGKYYFVIDALAKLAQMSTDKRHPEPISKVDKSLANLALKKHDYGDADVK